MVKCYNKPYLHRAVDERKWVKLKVAQTHDGEQQYIHKSNKPSHPKQDRKADSTLQVRLLLKVWGQLVSCKTMFILQIFAQNIAELENRLSVAASNLTFASCKWIRA